MTYLDMTCQDLIDQYLYILQEYDINKNGMIGHDEAVQATLDFFDYKGITKDEAEAINTAYLQGCTFPIQTGEGEVTPFSGKVIAIGLITVAGIVVLSKK